MMKKTGKDGFRSAVQRLPAAEKENESPTEKEERDGEIQMQCLWLYF